jgi:fatty acid desaturase
MSFNQVQQETRARGRGMLRAAAWTVGLFAVGGGICQVFPGPFTEPVVLLALGTTLFLVSGRGRTAQRSAEAPEADDAIPTRVAR